MHSNTSHTYLVVQENAMIPSKNIEISDLKLRRIYLTFAMSGQQSSPFMLPLIKRHYKH